ncbi:hypothetical protein LTR08_005094 [Meristemomyces frigidus]|nr:hypothetical protein LTR08_005094 [Meristemomyces frigidus]
MMNNTLPEYIAIRAVIILFSAIGPLCAAYTATLLRRVVLSVHASSLEDAVRLVGTNATWPSFNFAQYWCIAEAGFYLWFLYYRTVLQRAAVHPPLLDQRGRRALFEKVKSEIHDTERFLSGWFREAKVEDIGREDLKEFLAWTFWEGRVGEEDDGELEVFAGEVEAMLGRRLKEGRGTARSLRLTLEPVEASSRSLFWYLIIVLVDTATHLRLLLYGYGYHSTTAASLLVFPPRPLALVSATASSPAKDISFWLTRHTSKTRLPIVFLHGIGVGLHPYIEFFHQLNRSLNGSAPSDDKVGVLIIEVMQISTRLTTSAILDREEFLTQMTTVLDRTPGFEGRFVLCSHSYGSVFNTYLLTDPAMAARVSATLLIDPVTVLLHMPEVAYNFTVRKPRSANEWQLWYFASKDPSVAYTLGRHFFWGQNVLWREKILELVEGGSRVTVSLGSRDLIVDTQAVGAYLAKGELGDPVLVRDGKDGHAHMELEAEGEKRRGEKEGEKGGRKEGQKVDAWKEKTFTGRGLEVLWWDDFDHAQVFDDRVARGKLVDVLVEYSRDDSKS